MSAPHPLQSRAAGASVPLAHTTLRISRPPSSPVLPSPPPLTPCPRSCSSADKWDRKYSREVGAFPAPWVKASKFWPTVGRVDNVFGDRNLQCTCEPTSSYA